MKIQFDLQLHSRAGVNPTDSHKASVQPCVHMTGTARCNRTYVSEKLTYDPEDEEVVDHLQRRAHGVLLALVVDQRVEVEQQQEVEVGGAVDDELDEGRVDDLTHAGARKQKVADGEQRPQHGHAQHGGHLQTRVLAPVAGRLAEPDRVEELLTVGLGHELLKGASGQDNSGLISGRTGERRERQVEFQTSNIRTKRVLRNLPRRYFLSCDHMAQILWP